MSEQIKCPVCGKVGIPDYHKEEVICPCCGTDLSVYKMLADSQKDTPPSETSNKTLAIAAAVSAAIAIIAIATLCFTKISENSNVISNLKEENTSLTKSVSELSLRLESANKEIADLQKSAKNNHFIYIVKKNDSPCRISKKIYGTENRYKEIEAIITKPLQPGDTLILIK